MHSQVLLQSKIAIPDSTLVWLEMCIPAAAETIEQRIHVLHVPWLDLQAMQLILVHQCHYLQRCKHLLGLSNQERWLHTPV